MTATQHPAHSIKPGDLINGVEVFDTIRPALRGGYYIPLVDGTRYTVRTLEEKVTVA